MALSALVKTKTWLLKACFLDLYFGKSHLDCHLFYQHYKDHLDKTRATSNNRTLFAAFFFGMILVLAKLKISTGIHLRKGRMFLCLGINSKLFFTKILVTLELFINSILSKLRRDSQYQRENTQDWVFYLKYLQSIL